jgi:hypothetical protein
VKYGFEYVEEGLMKYEEKSKERFIKNLNKKARSLGMQLIPIKT